MARLMRWDLCSSHIKVSEIFGFFENFGYFINIFCLFLNPTYTCVNQNTIIWLSCIASKDNKSSCYFSLFFPILTELIRTSFSSVATHQISASNEFPIFQEKKNVCLKGQCFYNILFPGVFQTQGICTLKKSWILNWFLNIWD